MRFASAQAVGSDLSIVLIVRDRVSVTRQCLRALDGLVPAPRELLVVDDGSLVPAERWLGAGYPIAHWLRHDRPRGLIAAADAGMRRASGAHVLILPSTWLPLPGALAALQAHLAGRDEVGLAGSVLVAATDVVRQAGIVFDSHHEPHHLYAGLPADHPVLARTRQLQALSVAGAVVRRAAFAAAGGFALDLADDFASADFCLRVRQAGYQVEVAPGSVWLELASGGSGGFPADGVSRERFLARWGTTIVPDELGIYQADGLLRLDRDGHGGQRVYVSPLLGELVGGDEREVPAVRLLALRARQVFDLARDNLHLAARLESAAWRTPTEPTPSRVDTVTDDLRRFLVGEACLTFPAAAAPKLAVAVTRVRHGAELLATLASLLREALLLPIRVAIYRSPDADPGVEHLLGRVRGASIVDDAAPAAWSALLALASDGEAPAAIVAVESGYALAPGALRALLATADREPRPGAVSGLLSTTDGVVTFAGGVRLEDGAALSYGAGSAADDPALQHEREIDFPASQFVLVRREALRAVGAATAAPATAADFGGLLHRLGYTVRYQPLAVARRVSSGDNRPLSSRVERPDTDTGRRDSTSPALLRARDRRRGPRVLMIDEAVPAQHLGMGLPRTRAILEALHACGGVVTLLPRQDHTAYEPTTSALRRLGIEVLAELADAEGVLLERAGMYDVVVVARPQHAPIMADARRHNRGAVIIYDAEAVFAAREALEAEAQGTPLAPAEVARRLRQELEPLRLADAVICVSDAERRLIQRVLPDQPVAVCGHAVPTRPAPPTAGRTTVLFVGNLATPPNHAAAMELVTVIWPEVRRVTPGPLRIVGAGAAAELAARAAGEVGVELLGPVDDLTPSYDAARVFIAPHRFAAGIPLKVVEAMANGVPCVVSPLLAEQLGVRDGGQVLVALDAAGYAAACGRLTRDDDLWLRLQHEAQTWVAAHHSPERLRRDLAACLDAALAAYRRAAL